VSRRRAPRWTSAETGILREHYPQGGIAVVSGLLPHRSVYSIHVKAHKLGVRCQKEPAAPRCRIEGADLEEAIRLREEEGWSYLRIGARFGVAEISAQNAVLIALCERKGFRPAERLPNGRLAPEGLERLHYALRKGLKAVDISLRLGLSAACIAEQRRRYNADLKARGKAPLPPPGGGEVYSGAKVPPEKKKEAERLFLEGYGTKKVSEMAGVSKTVCTRVRARLIARLKRKGEVLPGCDAKGKRRVCKDSARMIPEEAKARLRALMLDRVPVRRAAMICGIGTCSAYKFRDELKADLGDAFPKPRLPGRMKPLQRELMAAQAIPAEHLWRFRVLVREHGDTEARRILRAEISEARRNRTFEERLAEVQAGKAKIAAVQKIRPARREAGVGSSAAACVEAA
jgi:hypothetical protein